MDHIRMLKRTAARLTAAAAGEAHNDTDRCICGHVWVDHYDDEGIVKSPEMPLSCRHTHMGGCDCMEFALDDGPSDEDMQAIEERWIRSLEPQSESASRDIDPHQSLGQLMKGVPADRVDEVVETAKEMARRDNPELAEYQWFDFIILARQKLGLL